MVGVPCVQVVVILPVAGVVSAESLPLPLSPLDWTLQKAGTLNVFTAASAVSSHGINKRTNTRGLRLLITVIKQ